MSSDSPVNLPAVESTAPSRFWRRWLIRLAFAAGGLGLLIVALYLEERVRGNLAWARYQEDARAKGVKLTLAEYLPPPIPPEQNFAEIPLFQEAFRPSPPPNPFELEPKGSSVPRPYFPNVGKDQPMDLSAWQGYFVATGALPAASESAAADVLQVLEKFSAPLEQLRGASSRAGMSFPVHYDDMEWTGPHLGIIQNASRVLALSTAAHLALGESEQAYEDWRLGWRLHERLRTEPTLIPGLVRLIMLTTMGDTVWQGIRWRQWKDSELEKIASDLAEARLMDEYVLVLGSERASMNLRSDRLMQMEAGEIVDRFTRGVNSLLPPDVPKRETSGGLKLAVMFYPRGWARLSQVRTNRFVDESLVRVSQNPPRVYPERLRPSLPDDTEPGGIIERMRYQLFLLSCPVLLEAERRYAYGQTLLDQTRIGCALERYRLAQSHFPDSLTELAPYFPNGLPVDVMTGEPLHYRIDPDGGCTLYAVGRNLLDEGGKLLEYNSRQSQPDWVWHLPAKESP